MRASSCSSCARMALKGGLCSGASCQQASIRWRRKGGVSGGSGSRSRCNVTHEGACEWRASSCDLFVEVQLPCNVTTQTRCIRLPESEVRASLQQVCMRKQKQGIHVWLQLQMLLLQHMVAMHMQITIEPTPDVHAACYYGGVRMHCHPALKHLVAISKLWKPAHHDAH